MQAKISGADDFCRVNLSDLAERYLFFRFRQTVMQQEPGHIGKLV